MRLSVACMLLNGASIDKAKGIESKKITFFNNGNKINIEW